MPPKRKRAEDTGDAEASSTRGTRSSTRLSTGSTKDDSAATSKPAPAKKATTKAAPKATAKTEAPAAKKAKTTAAKSTAKKTAPKKSKKVVDISCDVHFSAPLVPHSDFPYPLLPFLSRFFFAPFLASSINFDLTLRPISSDDVIHVPLAPFRLLTSIDQGGENSDSFVDDEPGTSTPMPTTPTHSSPTLEPAPPPKPKAVAATAPVKQASVSKVEPYTPDRAASLFKKYADPDDPNVIGPEGFSDLCTEAQIPLDGAGPLILAWQLNAKEMGKFTKEEWTKGTESLKLSSLSGLSMAVSDLETLLIHGKPSAKASTGKKDPYDKFAYGKYAANPKAAFQTLYSFCFTLAKPEQSRNIDMETSTALWSVLLVPQYPIISEVLEFITEKGTYKATNKDLWSMMLEFCRTVEPSLQDYEADGAWPTLLDDFVAWKKAKLGNGTAEAE